MTQCPPRLSVLEEIHGTLQWQPDNFEHFNSRWTPAFREPYSTPVLCHRCLFCFHILSSFQMLFPSFWEKHVRQPGETQQRTACGKKSKHSTGEQDLTSGHPEFFPVRKQVLHFRAWAQQHTLFYLSWCMTDRIDGHKAQLIFVLVLILILNA